jgi:nitrogen fixation NifU-like protein
VSGGRHPAGRADGAGSAEPAAGGGGYGGLHELYGEVILDHNRRPRNFGRLGGASHAAVGHNPLCGDRVAVYLQVAAGRIEEIAFEGVGCAISTASASMMTEALRGKSVAEARRLFERFHALLTTGPAGAGAGDGKSAAAAPGDAGGQSAARGDGGEGDATTGGQNASAGEGGEGVAAGGRSAAGGGPELGKLAAFAGVREFPMRVKCATLAWHALQAALDSGAPASAAGPETGPPGQARAARAEPAAALPGQAPAPAAGPARASGAGD